MTRRSRGQRTRPCGIVSLRRRAVKPADKKKRKTKAVRPSAAVLPLPFDSDPDDFPPFAGHDGVTGDGRVDAVPEPEFGGGGFDGFVEKGLEWHEC